MNKFQNIPEEIKEDVINFLEGKLTSSQANRLLRWLDENPENKKFFDQIADIWHISSSLNNAEEFDSVTAWNEVTSHLKTDKKQKLIRTRVYRIPQLLQIASVLVIIMLSGLLIRQYLKHEPVSKQFVEMTAPRGSRSLVVLADGSKVWLNSGSRIIFSNAFGKTSRRIELDGEAYFSVAKNKDVPFVVHASELNITAVGTAFNVKAYADENVVETTLEEGSVKIEPTVKLKGFSGSLILKPNQKAVFRKKISLVIESEKNVKENIGSSASNIPLTVPKRIEVDGLTDTKPYTSWKDSRWQFRHETMESLMHKLERRYDVRVIFKDDVSKKYTFSGSLYDESIEQVFEAIKLVAPIDFKIRHKEIEISTNKHLKEKYEKLQEQ